MIYSSILNIISKLLLFLQSILIAYYFGTHGRTDIYFFCMAFINMLATFINGMDSSVLIPESMRLTEQNGQKHSMSFLNFFIFAYLLTGILLSTTLLINPVTAFKQMSGFESQLLVENREILILSILLITLMFLTNLLGNILTSYKYFTMPMLAVAINNGTALLFLFLFHEELDISSALAGMLLAYTMNLVILLFLMKIKLKWIFSAISFNIEKRILKNIFFAHAGNITGFLASYIPVFLLSGFNKGVITTLNYGQKTSEIPNQLLAIPFSSVLGIKFNELYTKRDFQELNNLFLVSVKFLLFITIPLSLFIFIFNKEIISVLFERGSFDEESVRNSSEFLKYFILLLPMSAIILIISKLFMAGQKIMQSFWYQILLNLLAVFLTFLCVKYMGATGYPIALLVTYTANVILSYSLLKVFFPFIQYNLVFPYIFKLIIINGILILFINYIKMNLPVNDNIIQILGGFLLYFILLITCNYFLNINQNINKEVKNLVSSIF